MYQDSQRENVHVIKSIRAWKTCRSVAAIMEWNTISAAFGTKIGCLTTSTDKSSHDRMIQLEIKKSPFKRVMVERCSHQFFLHFTLNNKIIEKYNSRPNTASLALVTEPKKKL